MDPELIARSTDDVDPGKRLDYWVATLSATLFGVSSSISAVPEFSGSLTAIPFDELHVVETNGTMRSSFRTTRDVASAHEHSFHLISTNHDSSADIEWRGSRLKLAPGDLFFGDTRYVQSASRLTRATCIKLPSAWVHKWLRDADRLTGSRIARDSGWGLTLSCFVSQLAPGKLASAPLPARLLSDNLGALLALVESDLQSGSRSSHARRDTCLAASISDVTRQRSQEQGLTVADIASSLGLSARTVHRCLAADGLTFAGLLARFRIECARRMLETANFKRLTTAEIGRRSGFSDPSYFVRSISRHLGATPRQYRLATQQSKATPLTAEPARGLGPANASPPR